MEGLNKSNFDNVVSIVPPHRENVPPVMHVVATSEVMAYVDSISEHLLGNVAQLLEGTQLISSDEMQQPLFKHKLEEALETLATDMLQFRMAFDELQRGLSLS